MPADLEDLFSALGRQADALSLPGADRARRRGRQRRNRARAVMAAIVVLVFTGAGIVVDRRLSEPDPFLPATAPARIRGLAPVGEPLRLPEGRIWSGARISGTRVIAFSPDGSGGHETVAVDARTGKTLWRITGRESFYRGVAATADTVILLREEQQQPDGSEGPRDRTLEFHDPATGALTWRLPHSGRDRFVLHEKALVRLVTDTGTLMGYEPATGKKIWTAPGSDSTDPAALISGMTTEADLSNGLFGASAALYDPSVATAIPFTDERLVSISGHGRIDVRDIRTGEVRSVNKDRPGAQELFAYEGMFYTREHDGEVPTINTPSRVLYQPVRGTSDFRPFPCGHDRLCVHEGRDDGTARLLRIDAKTAKVLRSTAATPVQGDNAMRLGRILISGTGGDTRGVTLYDEKGEVRYSDGGFGGFVDDGNAVTLSRGGDGRFEVRGVSTVDYRDVRLATIPEISGRCEWNEELLTCPTGRDLWIGRWQR